MQQSLVINMVLKSSVKRCIVIYGEWLKDEKRIMKRGCNLLKLKSWMDMIIMYSLWQVLLQTEIPICGSDECSHDAVINVYEQECNRSGGG